MTSSEIVLNAIRAIEVRNQQAFLSLMHPDFEIHWPESLPYGGVTRGPEPEEITWIGTWLRSSPPSSSEQWTPK